MLAGDSWIDFSRPAGNRWLGWPFFSSITFGANPFIQPALHQDLITNPFATCVFLQDQQHRRRHTQADGHRFLRVRYGIRRIHPTLRRQTSSIPAACLFSQLVIGCAFLAHCCSQYARLSSGSKAVIGFKNRCSPSAQSSQTTNNQRPARVAPQKMVRSGKSGCRLASTHSWAQKNSPNSHRTGGRDRRRPLEVYIHCQGGVSKVGKDEECEAVGEGQPLLPRIVVLHEAIAHSVHQSDSLLPNHRTLANLHTASRQIVSRDTLRRLVLY